jgi:hypothetical protein
MTITNPSLSIDGDNASEIDLNALHARFPRFASALEHGFLSFDTNILNILAGFGQAFAVKRDGTIKLVAGGLHLGSDGPSYLFDVTVFATNELDCNGDDEVTFEDVQCRPEASKIKTILDFTNTPLGDINGDKMVGFDDFLSLSTNFGKPGGYLQGDLDVNGLIEFADFLSLSTNFGAGSQASLSAVPEPNSGVLLLAAGLLLTALRGKKTRWLLGC